MSDEFSKNILLKGANHRSIFFSSRRVNFFWSFLAATPKFRPTFFRSVAPIKVGRNRLIFFLEPPLNKLFALSSFFPHSQDLFWSKKKATENHDVFFRLTYKKRVCVFVCLFARENKKQRKKIFAKKEEKNNCLSSFHTRRTAAQQITTITYHYHRETERRRDGETESFRCCCRDEEEEDIDRI